MMDRRWARRPPALKAGALKRWLKRAVVHGCARAIAAAGGRPYELLEQVALEVRRRRKFSRHFEELHDAHNGPGYLTPADLASDPQPLRRVLIVGSCLAQRWQQHIECPSDFVLINNVKELPELPPQLPAMYDLQIVQIPLRIPLPDGHLWQLPHDLAAHERAFEISVERLRRSLALACRWNREHGLRTFVTNFLVPQQNPMGRLMPRYDLRNPMFFVERLNAALEFELAAYENMHLLDIDALAAVYGRRHLQDDAVDPTGHGALLDDDPHDALDRLRIVPFPSVREHYDLAQSTVFYAAAWRHVTAMVETLKRTNEVKLVIVDLDDTLWRGIAAEAAAPSDAMIEGWPLGLAEALAYLKKRGVLLAIVSKNDEWRIAQRWDGIMGNRLRLGDFVVRRIDWQPKAENVAAILAALNVLPKNAIFIDDNPLERAAIEAAFPALRTLGAYPLQMLL